MQTSDQLTVFDVPVSKSGVFRIYHDESGTDIDHSRFQLHGSLIVPEDKLGWALERLIHIRNGYDGCIHFSDLRDKSSSLKSTVASAWLDLYFRELSSHCFYKCMIVDTKSPAFDPLLYPKPYHLYNRTAMLSVWGGITWSLGNYDFVTVSLFSEEISRSKEDNFVDYLPREVINRSNKDTGKKHPRILIRVPKVMIVNGDPKKVIPGLQTDCEFIQLTDLLTGTVSQAINAQASQKIKLSLGQLTASWIQDSRLPPWLQNKGLHRRFSVSCYPDNQGKFYDVPLAIETKGQDKLPGF